MHRVSDLRRAKDLQHRPAEDWWVAEKKMAVVLLILPAESYLIRYRRSGHREEHRGQLASTSELPGYGIRISRVSPMSYLPSFRSTS